MAELEQYCSSENNLESFMINSRVVRGGDIRQMAYEDFYSVYYPRSMLSASGCLSTTADMFHDGFSVISECDDFEKNEDEEKDDRDIHNPPSYDEALAMKYDFSPLVDSLYTEENGK